MVFATAAAAIVGAAYGIYSGESQSKQARKGRNRQAAAQNQAMSQQSATAARSQGREAQRRRGRQIAIANSISVRSPTTPTALDSTTTPNAGTSRVLG
jgi:Flp pilus assembly protein TadB